MNRQRSVALKLLDTVTDGIDSSASDSHQRHIARSFLLICGSNIFSKLADLLANPKITLTWLMQAVGAPGFAISLLVPIRESGSMLPQLFMAAPVAARPRKAPLYQAGAAIQALAIAGMVFVALSVSGTAAGWLIVALMALFSLGRCLCSLVSKAVLGKVIPKPLRGQTTGWSATIAGLTLCAVAVCLLLNGATQSQFTITVLLLTASACWGAAMLVYGFIPESPEQSPTDEQQRRTLREHIDLLRTNTDLRKFVLVRALFMSSALIAPYYILLSGKDSSTIRVLAALLLASGLAKLLSSVVWGRWSDRSSRSTLMVSGLMVFVLGATTVAVHQINPQLTGTLWLIPILYFGLEIAHQGVRVARKTYIVNLASDETRVAFVAISNSLTGMLLLLAGLVLGVLTTFLPPIWLIGGLSLMCLAGVLLGSTLRDV